MAPEPAWMLQTGRKPVADVGSFNSYLSAVRLLVFQAALNIDFLYI